MKYPVVMIYAADWNTYTDQHTPTDDEYETANAWVIGALIEETDEHVAIAETVFDSGDVRNVVVIPKVCILSRRTMIGDEGGSARVAKGSQPGRREGVLGGRMIIKDEPNYCARLGHVRSIRIFDRDPIDPLAAELTWPNGDPFIKGQYLSSGTEVFLAAKDIVNQLLILLGYMVKRDGFHIKGWDL